MQTHEDLYPRIEIILQSEITRVKNIEAYLIGLLASSEQVSDIVIA